MLIDFVLERMNYSAEFLTQLLYIQASKCSLFRDQHISID